MTQPPPPPPPDATNREAWKDYQQKRNDEDGDDESFQLPVFRVKIKHFYVPLIVAIILAGLLAYITYYGAEIQITAVPFSEEEYGEAGGALFNGLFFTLVAGISSFLIYFLVKKKGMNALRVIMGVTFLFLGIVLTIFFGESVLVIFQLPLESFYVLLGIAAVVGFLMAFVFYSDRFTIRPKNAVVLIFGVLIGAFMGIIMPTWTTMMILLGISIWDIISVRKGPIKKIFQLFDSENQQNEGEPAEPDDPPTREEFALSSAEIGIGDIAFYALLASHALISTNSILVWGFATVGILLGAAWTLRLIRKNKILPGLPLSIFIGIGLYWLAVFLDERIRFSLFFGT